MPTACPCCSATGEAARSPPCIRAGGARSAASRRTPSRALTAGGADAADILAAIGPCARRCCYEVSAELYDAFVRKDGALRAAFTPAGTAGKYLLDLPAVIRADLRRLGVSDAQISDCGVCTICGGDDYFSHRVMGENRGTMAAFIKMPEKGYEKQCH